MLLAGCSTPAHEAPVSHEAEETAATSTEIAGEGVSSAHTSTVSDAETTKNVVNAGGLRRTYWLSVPPNSGAQEKLPLIFAFHGKDESAQKIRRYSHLDKAQALVVYLDGQDKAWAPAPYATTTGEQDLAFVDAVRAQVEEQYPVDPARVFAVGLSNGGGFAAFLGCQRPSQFTAIGAVSAAYYWRVSENCSHIPMKHIGVHGTADKVIEYDGGTRHNTRYESVPEVMAEMAQRNHCTDETTLSQIGRNGVKMTWHGCDAPLVHVRVGAGKHVWPGGEEDGNPSVPQDIATNEILDFWGVDYRAAP